MYHVHLIWDGKSEDPKVFEKFLRRFLADIVQWTAHETVSHLKFTRRKTPTEIDCHHVALADALLLEANPQPFLPALDEAGCGFHVFIGDARTLSRSSAGDCEVENDAGLAGRHFVEYSEGLRIQV